MKNQKILLAAALLALGAASCQKEEKVITQFTAGMEQSEAKTYLDGQLLKWVSGDQVKVYSDGANGADFDVTPRDGNATWAVLNGEITEGDSYTAIYPADIAASATSVTLPAVQNSADGSLAEFPMYAESGSTEFQFKNLCGALRIHLEADNCTNCTISRIRVTAGSAINGTYTVSTTTEGSPSLVNCTNGSNTTTLILGTDQPIGDSSDFYIYLPDGTYSNMQLTFYQPDGSCCTKSGSNVTVERSKCTPVEITNDLAFGPASNEIWYTTSNGSPISNPSWTGNTVNRNAYQDGHYVIEFASTVTSVPTGAFCYMFNLTSVTLPASVESIGDGAFYGCSNLTSATMPNVTSIGFEAFRDCSNLTSATMPNVTSIDINAFRDCSNLTSATMPNVESIGTYAFYYCSSLTNLTLSASTDGVPTSAFYGCSSLNVIYLPMSEAPSWLSNALKSGRRAASGTLHVRTDATSTDADAWPGFDDDWDIVADL